MGMVAVGETSLGVLEPAVDAWRERVGVVGGDDFSLDNVFVHVVAEGADGVATVSNDVDEMGLGEVVKNVLEGVDIFRSFFGPEGFVVLVGIGGEEFVDELGVGS